MSTYSMKKSGTIWKNGGEREILNNVNNNNNNIKICVRRKCVCKDVYVLWVIPL